jgi:hypothetical protein
VPHQTAPVDGIFYPCEARAGRSEMVTLANYLGAELERLFRPTPQPIDAYPRAEDIR